MQCNRIESGRCLAFPNSMQPNRKRYFIGLSTLSFLAMANLVQAEPLDIEVLFKNKPFSKEAQLKPGYVEYLQRLNSNLSPAEIDKLIAEDDARFLTGLAVKDMKASQSSSQCALRIASNDGSRAASDSFFKGIYERRARQHCLGQINFEMNAQVAQNTERARDSFVCSISRTSEGIAGSYSKHTEGMSGTVTRSRLFLPDKVTPFDNRRTVETYDPGVSGSIEFSCSINPALFAENSTVQHPRDAWREMKIAANTEVIAQFDAKIAADEKEYEDTLKRINSEWFHLENTSAIVDQKAAELDKCLQSYRWLDQKMQRDAVERASYGNGIASDTTSGYRTPDDICSEQASLLKARVSILRTDPNPGKSFGQNEPFRVGAAKLLLENIRGSGTFQKTVCQKQIDACNRAPLVGRATDSILNVFKRKKPEATKP